MVVTSISRLASVLGVLLFPVSLLAGGEGTPGADIKALALARHNFELAKMALENRIVECEQQKSVLSPALFARVKLTKPELETALFVLNGRAEDACEGELRGRLVIAASIYRATATHYQRMPTGTEHYSEDMLFGHSWKRMEFEARYSGTDEEQRKTLESMPELRKPFHLLRTLEKLSITGPN